MNNTREDPWSTDIEQALLGSLLKDNGLIDQAAASLSPDEFRDPLHARMYQAIVTLSGNSRVTPLTLCAAMRGDEGLESVGGLDYPETLALAAPYTATVTEWVVILKDYAIRRAALDVAHEMIEQVYEPSSVISSQKLVDEATARLLATGYSEHSHSVTAAMGAARVIEQAKKALGGERPPTVTTGLKKVDKALGGGFQGDDAIFIPGRSGAGKTRIWATIGLNAAWKGNAPVLLFSKEMPERQINQLFLSIIDFELRDPQLEQPIELWKHRAGALSNYDIARLERAQQVLEGLRLEICDDADLTLSKQVSMSRAFARRYPGELGLIGLDFLQNLEDDSGRRDETREQVVTRYAYGQKKLAKRLGWPVMATVQLKNKTASGITLAAKESPPTEEDQRESGSIQMAADSNFAVHRPLLFHLAKEPTVPHERQEWIDWDAKKKEIRHSLFLRGFKNRHGDPSALNLELYCDMACGVILDERPGRYRIPAVDGVADEELAF